MKVTDTIHKNSAENKIHDFAKIFVAGKGEGLVVAFFAVSIANKKQRFAVKRYRNAKAV